MTKLVSFVRAAGMLVKGRMFDMPVIEDFLHRHVAVARISIVAQCRMVIDKGLIEDFHHQLMTVSRTSIVGISSLWKMLCAKGLKQWLLLCFSTQRGTCP